LEGSGYGVLETHLPGGTEDWDNTIFYQLWRKYEWAAVFPLTGNLLFAAVALRTASLCII
jgi:hypothetical protein